MELKMSKVEKNVLGGIFFVIAAGVMVNGFLGDQLFGECVPDSLCQYQRDFSFFASLAIIIVLAIVVLLWQAGGKKRN
jgi:disulfide bond formation protein DsbB